MPRRSQLQTEDDANQQVDVLGIDRAVLVRVGVGIVVGAVDRQDDVDQNVDPDVDPDVDITGDMPEDVEYDEDGNPICANPDEDVLDGEQAPEMEVQGFAEVDTDLYE